jgi:hypothetical protein
VITQEDLSASGNTVHIKVDDLEKAKQALEAAGVRILNEMQDSKSLEDYYFNLVGGENE